MSEIIMSVYYSTIDVDYKGDENIAYIRTSKETVETYFYDNIADHFHSKIGCSTFENWLIEYTADDTTGLYIFLRDRDAIYVIYKPDGSQIEFDDEFCDKCEVFYRKPKGIHICHRCGNMKKGIKIKLSKEAEKKLALEINLIDTIEETMDELFRKMYKVLEENTENRYGGDISFSEVFELDEIKKDIYNLFLKVSEHNVIKEEREYEFDVKTTVKITCKGGMEKAREIMKRNLTDVGCEEIESYCIDEFGREVSNYESCI